MYKGIMEKIAQSNQNHRVLVGGEEQSTEGTTKFEIGQIGKPQITKSLESYDQFGGFTWGQHDRKAV